MKYTIILLLFVNATFGQEIIEKIEKIYYSDSDTLKIRFSDQSEILKVDLSKRDTISPGTNSGKGLITSAIIGKDTLRIKADNYPYARKSYVTVVTPKKKTVVAFRYNAAPSNFSQDYIDANQGKITIETPEVYELANILLSLSPSANKIAHLHKNTAYYKAVESYFKPYLNHPIFEKLNFSDNTKALQLYYEFRENSFIYDFQNNKIVKGATYNYVYGKDYKSFTNLFTDLLPLVQDFAEKSNFRKFYKKNKKYYAVDTDRVKQLLPIQNMWTWLEKEFPNRYNAYKVIFSPLITGSHSTQNFVVANPKTKSLFGETIMFICNADRYDQRTELTEKQKEALFSGVVFTEIDHNYVNPISNKYRKEIAEVFNANIWSEKNNHYNNPQSVFNEYMTHAVFNIWVLENFDVETANLVIAEKIKMNTEDRGFLNFKAFNDKLIALRNESPSKTIIELYPQIIEWSRGQIKSSN
ncbi:DUF4932 domain-containing protein [Flavobacterium sp. GCM10027622]|uniref:DUF4932 domain-containing protein n=1 Tax=unclassified Flavobacterium TaxID=196869 RepID=UPI003614649D